EFAHVAQVILRSIGIVEVISLLQNGANLGDAAEGFRAGRLAGKPIALPLVVHQVELAIAMAGDPDGAGWDIDGPAHGDEQRGEFLAIAEAIVQPLERPFEFPIAELELLAHRVANRLDFLPT